ncbi:MAG: hypothetical protein M1825_002017 [Sarcosagium campestre]|nr:MAG: hypothetical protein M1825_002017 [Sarcosagium campestre]
MSNYPPAPSYGSAYPYSSQPNQSPIYPFPPSTYGHHGSAPATDARGQGMAPMAAAARQTHNAFQHNANFSVMNGQQAFHYPPVSPAFQPQHFQFGQMPLPSPFPPQSMPQQALYEPLPTHLPAPLPLPPHPFQDARTFNPSPPSSARAPPFSHPPPTSNPANVQGLSNSAPPPPLPPPPPSQVPLSLPLPPRSDREEGELSDVDMQDAPRAPFPTSEQAPTRSQGNMGRATSNMHRKLSSQQWIVPRGSDSHHDQELPSAAPGTSGSRPVASTNDNSSHFQSGGKGQQYPSRPRPQALHPKPSPSLQQPRRESPESSGFAKKSDSDSTRRYGPMMGKSMAETRSLAVNAILNLLPCQIQFEDYVAEGVDREALKSIFAELRLKTPSQPDEGTNQTQQAEPPDAAKPAGDAAHVTVTTDNVVESPPARPPSAPKVSLSKPADAVATPSTTITPGTARDESQLPSSKILLAKVPTVSSTTAPSLAPLPKPSPGISLLTQPKPAAGSVARLERKDLIAQKLAARTNKSLPQAVEKPPSQLPEKLQTTANPVTVAPSGINGTGPNKADKGPAIAVAQPSVRPSTQTLPSQEITDNAKIDTNTIIRERTEALKRGGELISRGPAVAPIGKVVADKATIDTPERDPAAPASTPPLSQPNKLQLGQKDTSSDRSSIPGLFMASHATRNLEDTAEIGQQASLLPTQPTPLRRKRPVAADFDIESSSASSSFRRPLGRERSGHSVVIDISDDESADGEDDSNMDMEDARDSDAPAMPTDGSHPAKRAKIGDMPPLPDFPPTGRTSLIRNGTSTPNSALNTPPIAPGGIGKTSANEDLKRKEVEIQRMQKRIAELELRKAKQLNDRGQSPSVAVAASAASKTSGEGSSLKTSSTLDIDRLIQDTSRRVAEDKLELAEAKAAESKRHQQDNKAAEIKVARMRQPSGLKKAKIEELRRRREEIERGLSQAEAEVQRDRLRLEQIRREQDEREAAVKDALVRKSKLEEELGGLSEDSAEASAESEDEGQISDSQEDVDMDLEAPSSTASHASDVDDDSTSGGIVIPDSIQPQGGASLAGPSSDKDVQPAPASASGAAEVKPVVDEPSILDPAPVAAVREDKRDSPSSDPNVPKAVTTEEIAQPGWGATSQQPAEAAPESTSSREVGSEPQMGVSLTGPSDSVSDSSEDMDMEDAYDPESEMDIGQSSASASSSAPDKRAGAEALQFQPGETSQGSSIKEGDLEEGEISEDDQSDVGGASDTYEPPGAIAQSPTRSAVNSPPFSPAPASNTATFSPVLEMTRSPTPARSFVSPPPVTRHTPVANPAEDRDTLSPEGSLQATGFTITDEMPGEIVPAPVDEKSAERRDYFKPYQSPLKLLHSYRFRPQYLGDVTGGFRSLTYSHGIDSHDQLCRYEADGGSCNDTTCKFQHFRDMLISDDKILVQISDLHINGTDEEKREYAVGLRQKLDQLRSNKVKDFETIAREIASFRTWFINGHPTISE